MGYCKRPWLAGEFPSQLTGGLIEQVIRGLDLTAASLHQLARAGVWHNLFNKPDDSAT